MFIYKLSEKEHCHPDIGTYKSFGISIYRAENSRYLITIDDIFTKRDEAERFLKKCIINEVSPIHIMDIIEDYISA